MQTEDSTEPCLRVKCSKPGDTAQVSLNEEGKATIELNSLTGIGECVVHRNQKTWPKKIKVRLNLKGLEQLVIRVGERKWLGSVSSHDGSIRWSRSDAEGPETLIEPTAREWCPIHLLEFTNPKPIRVPLSENERWEIALPERWLDENPESIHISWIDFYR